MSTTWKLALAYLWREKKQTLALFIGILLAAALLTGIGSLFSSGLNAAKENARMEYGDWHYSTRCDKPWYEAFLADPTGEGFTVEAYGVETVRKAIEEPFAIQYVSADEGYMQLMGRTLLKGKMPATNQEIAMDVQTLRNLGVSTTLGSTVVLDGETFTLSGIVAEMPEKLDEQMGDFMQVFVGPQLDYGKNGSFIYLKFDESRPIVEQLAAFTAKYGVDVSTMTRNNGLASYVGADSYMLTPQEIWEALRDPSLGVPYVWGALNENQAMTKGAVLLALMLFAGFIIYSIFQVSVLRRMNQYSVMQTLGLTDGGIFRLLLCELGIVFIVAYSLGCLVGNSAAAFIYARTGRLFVTRNFERHSGIDTSQIATEQSVSNLPDAGAFQVDWSLMFMAALFLMFLLVVISAVLVRKMQKLSLRQMMVNDASSKRRSRNIMSLRRISLTGVLTKRFMFARKGAFIGILLSLAVGSVVFLSASYVIQNTRINNELTFAADDGLGSDVQLVEENGILNETIPEQSIDALREIDGVASVLPVRYMLGEITLSDGIFKWPEYYAETANDPEFEPDPERMARYGGIIVQTGEDDYRLKVNIYGYDDAMLEQLNDYLLEGSINPDAMRANDSVIVKTLVDGQGHYDGIALSAGDHFMLKTPRNATAADDALHFEGAASDYQTTSFTVNALVSRPLAKVDTTIGDDGETSVDIIMTQEQMQAHFGITGYQTVSIALADHADPVAVADAIRTTTTGIPGCVVNDYSGQIAAQELYLKQQMLFFYGIALVLLVASLLHIANSMNYLVVERRHEFAILRAMGITDSGFLRMLSKEGLRYGIYTSLVVVVAYIAIQNVLYYFLQHVYLYLHPEPFIAPIYLVVVIAVNLMLCMGTMCLTGRQVLKRSMLE